MTVTASMRCYGMELRTISTSTTRVTLHHCIRSGIKLDPVNNVQVDRPKLCQHRTRCPKEARVNFLMYDSGNPVINHLTSGNWDDTDDFVIFATPNPNAASFNIVSEKAKDDLFAFQGQGTIEEMTKDTEADAVMARLQEMNHSEG